MNTYSRIAKGFTEYDNWRYMKNEILRPLIHYTDTRTVVRRRLLVLLGNYYLVSLPNMTILKYINSNEDKGPMTVSHGRHPEYCEECYGAGKFDWISNVTGPNHIHSRYEFIRDKNYVLLYHKPNGEISKNNIWGAN